VAAGLSRGLSLLEAVTLARNYVLHGIENCHRTGSGYGTLLHAPFEEQIKKFAGQ